VISLQVPVTQTHSKCSKCRLCARTHALSRCLHWLHDSWVSVSLCCSL